ncbi:MFS transporter [Haloactinomyces albus]|uniref:MFS family permease n=1 Tax=Haloactinomyces albus TaxID=1352928 RepID=A0AAE3ZEL6_9ACTN|nr:MFS transporter [Haloactinomyces albus]MDR7303528.1 MFS family permease [Haloactinomyces albus]
MPAKMRFLLSAFLVSSIGTGMVYPFSAVYISEKLGLRSVGASMFFVGIALFTFVGAGLSGRFVDRNARLVCLVGLAVQTVGYLAMATLSTLTTLSITTLVIGLSAGVFQTAFLTILAEVRDNKALLAKVYSYRYGAMNCGMSAGAVLGGILVTFLDDQPGYRLIYVCNAVSFVPLLVVVAMQRTHSPIRAGSKAGVGRSTDVLRKSRVVVLISVQAMLVLAGYGQLNSTVPLQVVRDLDLQDIVLSVFFAVNTITIVVFLPILSRWLIHVRPTMVLRHVPIVWICAAATLMLSSLTDGRTRIVLVVLFAVIFGIGEVLYSMSFQTVLTLAVSEKEVGRANAVSSAVWAAAMGIGPACGIALASVVSVPLFWGVVVVVHMVTLLITARFLSDDGTTPEPGGGSV